MISKNAEDLIRKMLTYDQEMRPTIAEIRTHPYLLKLVTLDYDEKENHLMLDQLLGYDNGIELRQSKIKVEETPGFETAKCSKHILPGMKG